MTIVVITGASRGMGYRTAVRLAARGATVFAGARDTAALAERLRSETDPVATELDIRPLPLEVTDDTSVAAAAAAVAEATERADVLINNAAVPGSWAPAAEIGAADLRAVFEVDVFSPVRVTQAFLPLLLRAERPRLVMVSSGMGSFGRQTEDPAYADIAHLPYPAAKAAVNMLAVQYAKGLPQVLVTAVDPGLTATAFTGYTGHTVDEGVDPIVAAAWDTDGPSGRFLDRSGVAPW